MLARANGRHMRNDAWVEGAFSLHSAQETSYLSLSPPPLTAPHTHTPLSSLSTQGGSQKSSRVLSCFYLSLCACPVNGRHLGFPVGSAPPPPFMKSFLLRFRLGAQDGNLTPGWSFYVVPFPSGLEHLD